MKTCDRKFLGMVEVLSKIIFCWPTALVEDSKQRNLYQALQLVMDVFLILFSLSQFAELVKILAEKGYTHEVLENSTITIIFAVAYVKRVVCRSDTAIRAIERIEEVHEEIFSEDVDNKREKTG